MWKKIDGKSREENFEKKIFEITPCAQRYALREIKFYNSKTGNAEISEKG